MMLRSSLLAVAFASALLACNTYRNQLAGSERAFGANDHERTLALLRDLEPDLRHLSPQDQARYAWLRGMADYRLGYRSDARHWLGEARAMDDAAPGGLSPDAKQKATEALDELNAVVYAEGTAALMTRADEEADSNARRPNRKARKDRPKTDEKTKEPPAKEAP